VEPQKVRRSRIPREKRGKKIASKKGYEEERLGLGMKTGRFAEEGRREDSKKRKDGTVNSGSIRLFSERAERWQGKERGEGGEGVGRENSEKKFIRRTYEFVGTGKQTPFLGEGGMKGAQERTRGGVPGGSSASTPALVRLNHQET